MHRIKGAAYDALEKLAREHGGVGASMYTKGDKPWCIYGMAAMADGAKADHNWYDLGFMTKAGPKSLDATIAGAHHFRLERGPVMTALAESGWTANDNNEIVEGWYYKAGGTWRDRASQRMPWDEYVARAQWERIDDEPQEVAEEAHDEDGVLVEA
jgi:hypothetical protein